ncbi:unnamed protein product, partial [Rotaria sp. Silwood2]
MSSKHVNSNNKSISVDNTNQKSVPCAVPHRLTSSHHIRHHSYDTTSNTLAVPIFPSSRSNRKENNLNNTNTNTNPHSRFLPARSSHRHTSSFALDRSSFTDLNSNSYHQHNYSASQENLRLTSDVNPSSFTSIPIKNSIPSKLPSTIPLSSLSSIPLTTTTTNSTTTNSLTHSLPHLNNNLPSSSNSSTILNHFNIHNAKLI